MQMTRTSSCRRRAGLATLALAAGLLLAMVAATAQLAPALQPTVVFPLERTAYFLGEHVPLAITGVGGRRHSPGGGQCRGPRVAYRGKATALWLDTTRLAAGDYRLEVNGAVALERLTLTSPLRKSAGLYAGRSDAWPPQYSAEESRDPAKAAAKDRHTGSRSTRSSRNRG